MNRILIALLWLSASAAFAQSEVAPGEKSWKVSLIPLVAAHSLDAVSSWGYVETNPLLAGPDGRFGARSAAIKFSFVGAAAVAEYFLMKRHPKWAKLFTRANYGNAILTTSFAARNFAVR
jgi:hypothetical protein